MSDLKGLREALALGELHGREAELVWVGGILARMDHDFRHNNEFPDDILLELEALSWAILLRISTLEEKVARHGQ